MKRFLLLLFIIPCLLFADAVIFSGNDVKALKPNLDLFGSVKILSGSLNPSAGAGVVAPQGSTYMSKVFGLFSKTGAGNTAWTKTSLLPVNLTTDVTGILPVANGGTGSATQNFVDLTSPQTIGGVKTFSSTIVGNISGNAATVTTNANLTGDVTSIGNATTYNAIVPIAKGGTNSGTALTNNKAIQSVGGQIVESAVTSTELGYLSGATSPIQGQLDSKVTGPASATDNAITRYDTTTGKLIQNSLAILDDLGNIAANDLTYTDINFNTISEKESLAVIGSTGVMFGGIITIGAPNTTVTVSNGNGYCASNTGTNSLKKISWTGLTNQALTFINTNIITYLAINCSTGALAQQVTPFTNTQSRDFILLGAAVHSNLTIVNAVNQLQQATISPLNQLGDLQRSLGFFNVDGNIYSANGANLSLNRSLGHVHKQGSNWDIDTKNPNVRTLSSATALTFRYRTQAGAEGSDVTVVSPALYDLAGVLTAVPSARFTVQRINVFSTGITRIQYGQALYTSQADALASIQIDPFVTELNISENGLLRGFLVVRGNATDLTASAQAYFLEAPKFGGTGGVGGLSTTTLQGAYNNSSTPQVTTTTALGAVDFRRGSAADTDNVVRVQNGAGTATATITGAGVITGSNLSGTNTGDLLTKSDSDGADVTTTKLEAPNAQLTTTATGVRRIETGNVNLLVNPGFEGQNTAGVAAGWSNSGSTPTITTSSANLTLGKQAQLLTMSAQTLNFNQSVNTLGGIAKQGYLSAYLYVPNTVTNAQLCSIVDSVEQNCIALNVYDTYFNYQIPLVFGATNAGLKVKTTGAATGFILVDNTFLGIGLPQTTLPGDVEYRASVSSGGVVSGEDHEFITGNCTTTSPYTCTLTGFTVAPQCVATPFNSPVRSIQISSTSSTSVVVSTFDSTTGAGQNNAFTLSCKKTGVDYLAASISAYTQISVDSDWVPCTFSTLAWNGLGTVSPSLMCRKNNGNLEMQGLVVLGTVSAAQGQFLLPNNYGAITTKTTLNSRSVGLLFSSSAATTNTFNAINTNGNNYFPHSAALSTAIAPQTSVNGSTAFTTGQSILYSNIIIPIEGWTNTPLIVGSFAGVPAVPGYAGRVDTFSANYYTTNPTTSCTASTTCTIDQIGSGFTSIVQGTAGAFTINLPRTYAKFKCSGEASGAVNSTTISPINCLNCNSTTFSTYNSTTGAGQASYGTLMCQGTF